MKVAELKQETKQAKRHYEKLKKGTSVKLYDHKPPPKPAKA